MGERGRGGYVEQYLTSSGSIRQQPCSAITRCEDGAMRSGARSQRQQAESDARGGVQQGRRRDPLA